MKHWHIALAASTTLGVSALGCGSRAASTASGDRMTLEGTVAASEMPLDNARAIALSADGHAYAAYLDSSGDFSLQVPTGHAYRVVIANSLASGLHQVVGHVAITTSRGTSTWIGARAASKVDLGVLRATQPALRTMSAPCDCDAGSGGGSGGGGGDGDHHDGDDHDHEGDGHGGGGGYDTSGGSGSGSGGYHGYGGGHEGDHDDDHACEQDDDEHGKVCTKGGSYDVELSPSKNPGDACDDHDLDDDGDKKKHDDDYGSCDSKGGSGKSEGGSGGGHAGSQGGSGGGYSGGSTGGGHSYDAGHTTPAGGCKVSADCGGGSCVACSCTP